MMPEQNTGLPFVEKLDNFWSSFKREVSQSTDEHKIRTWLSEEVDRLQPGLAWEFVPWIPETFCLVITCENRYPLRPLVDEIIRKAPSLDKWSFSPTRPPVPDEMVSQVFQSRVGKVLPDCLISCSEADWNFIDIRFKNQADSSKVSLEDLFVLLEIILGEDFLQVWIGEISLDKGFLTTVFGRKFQSIPLLNLRIYCETLKNNILERTTPLASYFEQAKPKHGALLNFFGNPKMRSIDRLTSSTFYPQITKATLSDRFWSKRYSRYDETFCYLKIDCGYAVAARDELSDALDDVLRSHKGGCIWGSGAGLESSFIDLVLTDFENSLSTIKEFMNDRNIRCKLHFYDLSYQQVSIPIP